MSLFLFHCMMLFRCSCFMCWLAGAADAWPSPVCWCVYMFTCDCMFACSSFFSFRMSTSLTYVFIFSPCLHRYLQCRYGDLRCQHSVLASMTMRTTLMPPWCGPYHIWSTTHRDLEINGTRNFMIISVLRFPVELNCFVIDLVSVSGYDSSDGNIIDYWRYL